MSEDELIRKEQGARLASAREAAGFRSARDAALSNDWPESSYRAHENGGRTIDYDDAERYARRYRREGVKISGRQILYGDDPAPAAIANSKSVIRVEGRIGAGSEIFPDAEQVPPEGLLEIEVDFPVNPGSKAFLVEGMSMWPAYKDGDVVLCGRQIASPSEALIGSELAVQTIDGRRFLKTVSEGSRPGRFDLESHNAPPMRNQKLEWAAEIDAVLKRNKWRTISKDEKSRIAKRVSKSETV